MTMRNAWVFSAAFLLASLFAAAVLGPFGLIVGIAVGVWAMTKDNERQVRQQYRVNGYPNRYIGQRDALCMQLLQRRGFDARIDNQDAWRPYCQEVLRNNAIGNYIGYTSYNRAQARRDAARRMF